LFTPQSFWHPSNDCELHQQTTERSVAVEPRRAFCRPARGRADFLRACIVRVSEIIPSASVHAIVSDWLEGGQGA
jgi:hypothetical protein